MTDFADSPLKRPPSGDLQRLLFWGALSVAAVGAGIAIAAGEAAGRAGAILLIAIAAAALVFFVWMSRGAGRLVGLFPTRGATEAAAAQLERTEFAWLEALDEPAMVADRTGAPLAANSAYGRFAALAGALGESDRPPHVDRLFGADPLISPALFRLARAAANRQVRRENLPPTQCGSQDDLRLEVIVSPLAGKRALWRLCRQTSDTVVPDESLPALFINEAPMGFVALDRDGVIVFANRALRAVVGGADGWPAGASFADLIADDAGVRAVLKDRASSDGVLIRVRTAAGGEQSAIAHAARIADEAGDLWRVYIDFDAVEKSTLGARAASSVCRSGAALAAGDGFFARAPFGAALLDSAAPEEAIILDANGALMELSAGRAMPGARFAELFEVADGPVALAQRLKQALRGPVEITLAGDGAVTAHLHLAETGDGQSFAYVVNVSEQRELQQRLAQAEKMREIGLLAGGVAHDFNNLLTVVMMNCDYLLRRHPVGDPDFQDLSEINLHALRAKELSEMLRAYARQQTFKRELIEPTAFFAGVQELVRRLVGETVSFELRHGRDLPFVKVDKSQLERVIVNLASNARDAMTGKDSAIPRDGRLTIRTSRTTGAEARALGHTPIEDGDYLLIEVIDTGCGIKAEDQARIFRPFHSTKEAGRGTGLGLATSYGIVKQHEGYIFFDSRVGVGTTFRVYLRAHAPSVDEVAERARLEEESKVRRLHDVAGRGRILLVEDEMGVRKSIARNLAECGYEVDQAEDGEDGLDKLRVAAPRYDLIISDVSMPIMKGPEMLEAAGAELIGDTPVLFLSGFAPEEFAQVLEKYPVSYMAKPVGFADLAKRVKELILP
jgi:two-component system cell cycle sensor histidine kinase/response regulator CckA